jgi:NAD-dependent SIR2 family protein deacetylase
MFQQKSNFIAYWVNKSCKDTEVSYPVTMNKLGSKEEGLRKLSELSPKELNEYIEYKREYLMNHMEDDDIKKIYEQYKKMEFEIDRKTVNFWVNTENTGENYVGNKQNIIESLEIRKSKNLLKKYNKILILAGAGMSQESDLPVFRPSLEGHDGSENISSILVKEDYSNTDELIDLFDSKKPHDGYDKLLEFCKNKDYYIMTSNIDKYFYKAGFDEKKIVEIHGNIYNTQCINSCNQKVYKYDKRNRDKKYCDYCNSLLRPNVLLFNDPNFIDTSIKKDKEMVKWINKDDNILIIELGAGIVIPTIRDYSEILINNYKNMSLIRVNLNHWVISDKIYNIKTSKKLCRMPFSCKNFILNIL